jgi:hypothetical protein
VYTDDSRARFYYKTKADCEREKTALHYKITASPTGGCVQAIVPGDINCVGSCDEGDPDKCRSKKEIDTEKIVATYGAISTEGGDGGKTKPTAAGGGSMKGNVDRTVAMGEAIIISSVPPTSLVGAIEGSPKVAQLTIKLLGQTINGQSIDTCKLVQSLIARESKGIADASSTDGGCYCGLMMVDVKHFYLAGFAGFIGTCEKKCQGSGGANSAFNPAKNIEKGVELLLDYFDNPYCGKNTSCTMSKDGPHDGFKRYKYMLAAYNAGPRGNELTNSCRDDSDTAKDKPCTVLAQEFPSNGCFINVGNDAAVYPTKVECPINRRDYEITYKYVKDIEFGYGYLKQLETEEGGAQDGDGIASCP